MTSAIIYTLHSHEKFRFYLFFWQRAKVFHGIAGCVTPFIVLFSWHHLRARDVHRCRPYYDIRYK